MKLNGNPSSSVCEVAISSSEFFQNIGVLVVEGRLPEFSKNGRRTGTHSWPITKCSQKLCFQTAEMSELCKLVSSTRLKIHQVIEEDQRLFIEVLTSSDGETRNRVSLEKSNKTLGLTLLEIWEVKFTDKTDSTECVNVNMVLQAVRSYLHFSQLSAWWNATQGKFPHSVIHRITSLPSSSDSDFLEPPTTHTFPSTQISKIQTVQIKVTSLPRMDVSRLRFHFEQARNLILNKRAFLNDGERDNLALLSKKEDILSNGRKESTPECGHSSKRKEADLDSYCTSHCRTLNCQRSGYVGEKLLRFDTPSSPSSSSFNNGSSNSICCLHKESDKNNAQDCISLSNTAKDFNKPSCSKSGLSRLLSEKKVGKPPDRPENLSSLLEDFVLDGKDKEGSEDEEEDDDLEYEDEEDSLDSYKYDKERSLAKELLEPCTKQRPRSKSVSPNFTSRQQPHSSKNDVSTKPIAARRLAMVAATVPIFNKKTGLPLSSSPAPIKRPPTKQDSFSSGTLSKSTSLDDLQTCSYGLSKSAPVPSSLLGNFEESVLNGRMPANGTLEGFFAELGASGTFCPKHVTLPMEIQYFSLSDDNAPSPYLGRIILQDKKKRTRYRVPRKGTIQLTIFNPNKTVVKVFIVLYNFEDMPKCSRTFVRQKIVSDKSKMDLPTLHYLIHLSFVSSKSSQIYLHTDIRVLFRQREPDEPLRVLTHGPSDPKYTHICKKAF